MTRNHERLLVATLAGMIIAGAAMFAMQPAIAQPFGAAKASSQPIAPIHQVLDLKLSVRT